jgi:SsrA-binding protein
MAKGKRKAASGDVATNRQASFRYNLLDRFECGIVLTGTEVKSLREGLAQMKDSYVTVRDGEAWLIGLYIAPYPAASRDNHDPERDRKLLLHREEIEKIEGRTREKGLTVVPTRIYFTGGSSGAAADGPKTGSRAKVEIAIAKGKDLWDKRDSIRTRDVARDVARELREVGR